MANLEIVTSDEDAASLHIQWSPDSPAFVTHVDTTGVKNCILVNKAEARQVIAALESFVAGRDRHMSDCALHQSPAYPIEPCNCSPFPPTERT